MAERYNERGQRWDEGERRFRDRDDHERGFWDRFNDEVRSWFGDEEAQRRRMRDEREDWRGEARGRDWGARDWRSSTWGPPDWSRGDWRRPEWDRGDRVRDWGRSEWRGEGRGRESWRSPEEREREWNRPWGFTESRGGYGSGGHIGTEFGAGSFDRGYGAASFGPAGYGYGAWGRDRGQHTGRGPRTYTRTDERIREDVCERLTEHPHLDATDLDIRVQNGDVTLTGSVNERWAKHVAEDIAESVSGVKQVHNEIRIMSQQGTTGTERQEGRDDRPGPRSTWAA